MTHRLLLTAIVLFHSFTMPVQGALVLNEVMVNSSNANDGVSGQSGEWVELFNNGLANFDASGYILSDGDWTIVFPASTIIAPGQFFLVGFAAFAEDLNGATIDLNVGALSASQIGGVPLALLNLGEYLGLYDTTGLLADGVTWGSPAGDDSPFTPHFAPLPAGHPLGTGLLTTAPNYSLTAPGTIGQGQSIMRTLDGAGTWVINPGGILTSSAGLPNAAAIPEPNSMLLLGSAMSMWFVLRRRKAASTVDIGQAV